MNINKSWFLVIVYGLLISLSTAWAQQETSRLSLDDIQTIVLDQNKDLIAARFLVKEAEGRLKQAGLWSNPELELGRTSDRTFNNEGEYTASAGFNQKFPISGRLARAKTVARVDVALALAEVRNQERLLLGEALKNTKELLVIEEKLRLNDKSQVILKELISASEKRLKQAEISPIDLNLEKIELQKLILRASSLNIEQQRTRISLNTLLGRAPQDQLAISATLKPSDVDENIHASIEEAIERRPDRQVAALQIDRASAEIKLAKAETFEDWTIGLGYDRDLSKFDSALIEDKKDDFLGVRLTIPLPLWNQNEGNIMGARATRSRAQAELSSIDLKITSEIESARAEVLRLLPVVKQYEEESLKLSEDNARILHRSYSDGLVPISSVIQAQQQLVEIREAYTDSLKDFVRASTDLETALASSPFLLRSTK